MKKNKTLFWTCIIFALNLLFISEYVLAQNVPIWDVSNKQYIEENAEQIWSELMETPLVFHYQKIEHPYRTPRYNVNGPLNYVYQYSQPNGTRSYFYPYFAPYRPNTVPIIIYMPGTSFILTY